MGRHAAARRRQRRRVSTCAPAAAATSPPTSRSSPDSSNSPPTCCSTARSCCWNTACPASTRWPTACRPRSTRRRRRPVTYMAFDVLRLYGVPLLARHASPSGAPRWSASTSTAVREPRALPDLHRRPRAVRRHRAARDGGRRGQARRRRLPAGHPQPRLGQGHAPHACRRAWSGGWRPENVGTARVSATRVGALLLGVPDARRAAVRRAGRLRAGVRGRAAGPARAARRRRPLAVRRARSPVRMKRGRGGASRRSSWRCRTWAGPTRENCAHPVYRGIRDDLRPPTSDRNPEPRMRATMRG